MKIIKIFLLSLIMAIISCSNVFAEDNHTYTWTVPPEVNLSASSDVNVTLDTVNLEDCYTLNISVQSQNGYKLISDDNHELTYTLNDANGAVSDGQTILTYKKNVSPSTTANLTVSDIEKPTVSGRYTDYLTFTSSLIEDGYTITYIDNGGTMPDGAASTYKTSTGQTLPVPEKSGYEFIGWCKTSDLSDTPITSIAPGTAGNLTLYANWSINTYDLKYELNGGTGAENTTYTIEDTINLPTPTKEGYIFLGWTGSNGETPQTSVTIAAGTSGDKTYTANWQAESYSISYNLDGGTNNPANPSTYTVEDLPLTLQAPTKDGYAFLGWHDGTNYVTGIPAGTTGSVSLTANWEKIYSITYNLDGGILSAGAASSYTSSEGLSTLPTPTKDGYTFAGWYETIDNPYAGKVSSAQKLYDVGETNLTSNDIVTINGVDCYVLKIDGDKAELITTDIYEQIYTEYGYNGTYNVSKLRTYMDKFYTEQLNSDPFILNSEVTYLYEQSTGGSVCGKFTDSRYIVDMLAQNVFALNAIEAQTNISKFGWAKINTWEDGFWVAAADAHGAGEKAFYVANNGTLGHVYAESANVGARPAFWLSLNSNISETEITSIPSGTTGDKTLTAKWEKLITYKLVEDFDSNGEVSKGDVISINDMDMNADDIIDTFRVLKVNGTQAYVVGFDYYGLESTDKMNEYYNNLNEIIKNAIVPQTSLTYSKLSSKSGSTVINVAGKDYFLVDTLSCTVSNNYIYPIDAMDIVEYGVANFEELMIMIYNNTEPPSSNNNYALRSVINYSSYSENEPCYITSAGKLTYNYSSLDSLYPAFIIDLSLLG